LQNDIWNSYKKLELFALALPAGLLEPLAVLVLADLLPTPLLQRTQPALSSFPCLGKNNGFASAPGAPVNIPTNSLTVHERFVKWKFVPGR
jgi:hypothetical protein